MKRLSIFFLLTVVFIFAQAQSCYWVVMKDKAGTTFDPYSYFDSKAIERYRLCGADLYDISNYPMNEGYVSQVVALSTEEVGQSRWLNAVAVMATEEQIAEIEQLPFVEKIDLIASGMEVAESITQIEVQQSNNPTPLPFNNYSITDQLKRMQGELFVDKGIDGTGVHLEWRHRDVPH